MLLARVSLLIEWDTKNKYTQEGIDLAKKNLEGYNIFHLVA